MNAYIDIGGSETLTLRGALLVYEGRGRGFVAWHEAKRLEPNGAPVLGEAQALTTEFVERLAQGLGSCLPTEWLPENVLARTADTLVWWTAQSTQRLFFRPGSGVPDGVSGQRFPQPPLVWKVMGRTLSIRALLDHGRPQAQTPLLVAPYWNTDGETGRVCQGSMRAPEGSGVAAMPTWEQSFFQSEFTHPTGVRRLTCHPEGYFGVWQPATRTRRRFPADYLVPADESLNDFLLRD